MKCDELMTALQWLLAKCCWKKQKNEEKQLDKPLVREMDEIKFTSSTGDRPQKLTNSRRKFLEDEALSIERISTPDEDENQVEVTREKFQTEGSRSQLFYSIESPLLKKERSISRTDKLTNQLQKIKSKNHSQKESVFYSQSSGGSSDWELPTKYQITVDTETNRLKEWFKKEFEETQGVSFKINHAVQLKMRGKSMINLLTHKFEDFQAHYMSESATNSLHFINSQKTLQTLYIPAHSGANKYRHFNTVMSSCIIKCSTTGYSQILKLLISKQIWSILYNFSSIKVVQHQGNAYGLSLPILQVEYEEKMMVERSKFHIATQLNIQSDEIQMVSFSIDQIEQNWLRVVKIKIGKNGVIQLYSESKEEQINYEIFQKKFDRLHKYLLSTNLIHF